MTYAEANRRYFDSISDTYDTKPWWTTVNNQVATALRSDLSWYGIPFADPSSPNSTQQVRLLDYACGTGLMTRVFGPYVTQTKGIDVSPNMVSTYNTRARDAGIGADVVHAVVGDLLEKGNPAPEELEGEDWYGFDVATVGFGFHHFEDVVFAARQLKGRLRPGGVLVINDFLEGGDLRAGEDGEPVEGSEGNHAVHHHGHGHGHGHHAHGHHEHHEHHHHHDEKDDGKQHDTDDTSPEFKKKMEASIVVPHFTIQGVRDFFTEAGFVDVDVVPAKERSYMEFADKKMWRTMLFAKGRRPVEEKSEL
ncbi:S-adenosyl-L-methionine-dependent methyltransferase [Decorospora gaudefroyi]|uniref:S-adenosyl-L-methionine-dependent methyltransferase n=1 Tax=Decorospora gaudefroyi TaxID=184978 RepID=A0A6A5KN30_9PLEO|nr:S-adenosyl-L-methionine-dependent methyltransferase [Decorospora gaudefroyi]